MDKITYLAELAEGLARWVPERERQDILRYYAEYFEEAGPGREGEVVAELGDPWALSCRLAVEGGFVTQEAANAWTPPRKRGKARPFVLAGTLAAVAIVAVSVGFMASRVGRLVGRFASRMPQVAVVEGTDFAGFVPVYDQPGAIAEYIDDGMISEGFWNMEDGLLDAFDAIDAEVSLGSITVTGGDDYTLFIKQDNDLGGYTVDWEVKDGVLKLRDGGAFKQVEIDDWKDIKNLFSGMGSTLDVVVTVPEGVGLEKVSAKTDLGNIFLANLDVVKKVEAETSMGKVECYEMRTAKKLDLKTSMGDVVLGIGELHSGMELDLETSMGNVKVDLGCYERECSYEIETDMGTVTVNGRDCGRKAEQKGELPFKLDAESDMGDVDVCFYTGQKG